MNRFTKAAVLVAGLAMGAGSAQAAITPNKFSTEADQLGGYRFSYGVVLTDNSKLVTGDYFTIYDFAGYIDGSARMPTGWTVVTSLLGMNPAKTNPIDNPEITNLTFVYTGSEVLSGSLGLGTFSARSVFSEIGETDFTARTHLSIDPTLQTIEGNITTTGAPVGTHTPPPPGVPEPATLALFGAGLPIAVARFLRSRRRKDDA